MKVRILFFVVLMPIYGFGQINETFDDGDFNNNPSWTGDTANFEINKEFQLQSAAKSSSTSALFTESEIVNNAVWEAQFFTEYTTSSSNYSCIYIIADNNIVNELNGYYVQIGGTNDEVSLFFQQGTKKTKIIDGQDKRTDGSKVNIWIRVKRDDIGNYELWSKREDETEYQKEGEVFHNIITNSYYAGLLFSNTNTTGNAYKFDNIKISGEKGNDNIHPYITNLKITEINSIEINFSEKINIENLNVTINEQTWLIEKHLISTDKAHIKISFQNYFEKGIKYEFLIRGINDYAGNEIENNIYHSGITETAVKNDLTWNEVMFNHPESGAEYVEIFNRSAKVIDLSGIIITTRKADGVLNSGSKINDNTYIYPFEYVAFSTSPDSVVKYHKCPQDAIILDHKLSSLNNTGATIVLCDNTKSIIYDEFTYNEKMHHKLIKNTKGVAIEKIHTEMLSENEMSWHSAGHIGNYGTPGYKNSQYREITDDNIDEKIIWVDSESFSPNNDGANDVCILRYKNNINGYYVNIRVMNAEGIIIYEIANNRLLKPEDYMIWDGKTTKNKTVNPGIYIIYLEAQHPTNSQKIIKKIPVVVTF
ncbi:MAG: lamin tail domain-containing protein [Paludibacteraceae bacterium]|nr:lamin tail domain-containing protein [Paludibacteraceae bacterium]